MAALPLHPTLTHPVTGAPLRAVFVSEKTGRIFWPLIGASEPPPAPTPPNPPAPPPPPPPAAPSFPANTPVEQMTVDQQAAYWKAAAQKHQGRSESNYALLRQLGVTSADEAKAAAERLKRADELDAQNATEIEKREKAARDAATADADTKYRPQLAETAFRVAIGDRKTAEEISDFIADLNLSRFVGENGQVDTAKVWARVEQFAPAKGTTTPAPTPPPRGPVVPGHTPGGPPPAKSVDGARAYLARRGIKVE